MTMLGRYDKGVGYALMALEYAWEIGGTGIVLTNVDLFLNPLRDESRFYVLLEKWRDPSKR